MLRVKDIDSGYGPIQVLFGVSLEVNQGEVVCLLGANGAGKTTLLNVLSGLQPTSRGEVSLSGQRLTGMKASKIVSHGVVQVPEGRQLFSPLTVLENLEMGAFLRRGARQKARVQKDLARVLALFPVLEGRLNQVAGTLSGGEQQMLAIARGLMAAPRILLLDEPSLGLAPMLAGEIFKVISSLAETGCAVLLVEQNALGALEASSRGYVLVNGVIRLSGSAAGLMKMDEVQEAYLGGTASWQAAAMGA